jgi:hypothetical protein
MQEEELEKLTIKIDQIDKKLTVILALLENMQNQSNIMTEHVNFVNRVYDNIKAPFHATMNIASQYLGTVSNESSNKEIQYIDNT